MYAKKILTALTSLLLAAAMLFLAACGDDPSEQQVEGGTRHTEYGIHYIVPDGFEKTKVTLAENVYTDKSAYLYFNQYTREYMADTEEGLGLPEGITVYEYARWFMGVNDIPMNSGVYDEEKNTYKIVWDVEEQIRYDEENDMHFTISAEHLEFFIIEGTYYFYVVTASCPPDDVAKYEEAFALWFDHIYVD